MLLIVLLSNVGTTSTPFLTWAAEKNLLIVGLVDRFLGVSPDFLQWSTAAESGSPSCIDLQVSNDPKGRAEEGLDKKDSRSWEDAAVMAGRWSRRNRSDADVARMSMLMRFIFIGRSSRNLSMAQSWTVQDVGDRLHVSLMMC